VSRFRHVKSSEPVDAAGVCFAGLCLPALGRTADLTLYVPNLPAGDRALHQSLQAEGIAHAYEEHDGGHNWEYWRERVRATLRCVSEIEERGDGISEKA
jgi:hypothetical protein